MFLGLLVFDIVLEMDLCHLTQESPFRDLVPLKIASGFLEDPHLLFS